MAVRVRKLAKELRRGPDEVLGILHAIGFTRFRSHQDMLSDQIVLRLRTAIRDGVVPMKLEIKSSNKEEDERPLRRRDQGYTEGELEMDLSKWLDKQADQGVPAALGPSQTPGQRVAGSVSGSTASADSEAEKDRVHLQQELEQIRAERERLHSELQEVRDELAAVKESAEASAKKEEDNISVRLTDLLEARGLRGMNEYGLAMNALTALRVEQDWLGELLVETPERFTEVLQNRLTLVAGESTFAGRVGLAAVQVSADRAERASDEEWRAAVEQISEALLLFGLRRVRLVGGQDRAVQFLRENIDRRIQIQWVKGETRTATLAESDVHRQDAVLLWGVEADEAAQQVYGASKPEVLFLREGSIQDLSNAIQSGLG